ncbi:MAG: glycosyltransferase family 39 protein [Deinococcus sp.]|nr:glycosyltransferase family 39 protein [Deinococcus sp.]
MAIPSPVLASPPVGAPAVTSPEPSLFSWLVAHPWRYRGVITGVLLAYCLLGLGGSIGGYDEAFYTTAAQEMLARRSFWTLYFAGEPRYYKPPLTMWAIMASYTLLGESDWAARLPGALLAGVAALLVLALAWELYHDPQINLLALLLLLFPLTTVALTHMVQTDIYLYVGLAAGVYAWFRARTNWRWYALFALGLGWGLLSKSAAGLALPVWALLLALVRQEWRRLGWVVAASGVGLLLIVPYLLVNLANDRQGFVQEAVLHEVVQRVLGGYGPAPTTLLGHLLFYPAVLLVGSLPWTPLLVIPLLQAFRSLFRREAVGEQALGWWLVLPLVTYTLIQGKLPAYIFPVTLSVVLLSVPHIRRCPGQRLLAVTAGLVLGLGLVAAGVIAPLVRFAQEPQFLWPGLVLGLGYLVLGVGALRQLRAGRLLACRDGLLVGVAVVGLVTLATNPFNYNPDFVAFSQLALPDLPVLALESTRPGTAAGTWLLVEHYLHRIPLLPGEVWVGSYLARLPELPPHVLAVDRFTLQEISPRLRYQLLAQGRKWRLLQVEGPAS